MIPLDSIASIALDSACPDCGERLDAEGWHMPGMRMLARARCRGCGRPYFVDLPAGQGLYSPMILDPATGAVHDRARVPWFADWLAKSYLARAPGSPAFKVERKAPLSRPAILINCLDTLYGHALLKLFNAQQYLEAGTFDVILIVQPFLAALVPEGVAETWTVDLPLREGIRWSDGLAGAIAAECSRAPAGLYLAPVHPHPHPTLFSIELFSKVAPFPLDRWHGAAGKSVTFIWRDDDRVWSPAGRLLGGGQAGAVAALFKALRALLPDLDAAVAGIGTPGGLPASIADLRSPRPGDDVERDWLRRYSASHAVIGVHGSNMLLPSAHAGSVFELLPDGRQGNFLQDIVFNGSDIRDLFFRYRFVPDDIPPVRLARLVALVLARYPDFDGLMSLSASRDPDVRP